MQRLVETSKHDPNSQIYPFIVIELATAMRTVEFLKIRREHIDIERQAIYVPAAKTSARAQPIKKARPIFWPTCWSAYQMTPPGYSLQRFPTPGTLS
jgi:hypothetical protein